MKEIWKMPLARPPSMGSRTLCSLRDAARKARARNAYIVGYVNPAGECGYRVYSSLKNNWGVRGPMNDCAEGWSLQLIGRYKGDQWIPMRTTESQSLLNADPLTLEE